MEANIYKLGDEDSNITSYDRKYISENSHFQFHSNPTSFKGPNKFKTDFEDSVKIPVVTTPTGVVLHQVFEEQNIKVLFRKSRDKSINIYLRNVILLDSQSTKDLFCNPKLFGKVYKSKKRMYLQSNGGNILNIHKACVAGYKPHVCFDQKAITNLIFLKNIIYQYHDTYDSLYEILIVHGEEHVNHNMHFRMYESGLHYYNLEYEDFMFVNTVAGNK